MIFSGVILSFLASASGVVSDPGLILEGAMVYVSADSRPQKHDILVRDGKIAFVGDGARARRMAPGAARVDLAGSFVFPGWSFAQGHLGRLVHPPCARERRPGRGRRSSRPDPREP